MENKLIKLFKISLLMILLVLVSCGAGSDKKDPDDEALLDIQNQQFFDIVYLSQGYRELGSSTWRPVSGQKKMKFCSSNDETCTSDIGLEFNEEDENPIDTEFDGYFAFFHIRYQENQFNEPCSGGYIGYYIDSANYTPPANNDVDDGWNIFDPYDGDFGAGNGDEEVTDEEEVGEVFGFTFYTRILPDQINLDVACPSPEYNSTYEIVRYENGDVITTDYGRGVQYFFKPLLQ